MMFFTQGYEDFLLKNINNLDLSKLFYQVEDKRYILFPGDFDKATSINAS